MPNSVICGGEVNEQWPIQGGGPGGPGPPPFENPKNEKEGPPC